MILVAYEEQKKLSVINCNFFSSLVGGGNSLFNFFKEGSLDKSLRNPVLHFKKHTLISSLFDKSFLYLIELVLLKLTMFFYQPEEVVDTTAYLYLTGIDDETINHNDMKALFQVVEAPKFKAFSRIPDTSTGKLIVIQSRYPSVFLMKSLKFLTP